MRDYYKTVFGWFPESNAVYLEMILGSGYYKTVIEIGSFLGKSTTFFAARVPYVIAIDTFKANDEHYITTVKDKLPTLYEDYKRNILPFANIATLVMSSIEAAELDITADLIYLDGSHKYNDVKRDIMAWSGKGLLCGDDFHFPEVNRAVRELVDYETDGRMWRESRKRSQDS